MDWSSIGKVIVIIVILLFIAYRVWKRWPEFKSWKERSVVVGGIVLAYSGLFVGIMIGAKWLILVTATMGALAGAFVGGIIGTWLDKKGTKL